MAAGPSCVWLQVLPTSVAQIVWTVITVRSLGGWWWLIKWPPSIIPNTNTQGSMRARASLLYESQRVCDNAAHERVCFWPSRRETDTDRLGWTEQRGDVAPDTFPVLYVLKYTNVFHRVDPVCNESGLISLMCVEKISIYMTRSPVRWKYWDGGKERGRAREMKTGREEKEETEGDEVQWNLFASAGFWSCEASRHRSQESDKLGKKLYCASRAAKSIKVMPSAYININALWKHTQKHAHTNDNGGRKKKKRERIVLMGSPLLFPPTVKSGKIKINKK